MQYLEIRKMDDDAYYKLPQNIVEDDRKSKFIPKSVKSSISEKKRIELRKSKHKRK